jgi:hypothetical protein
VTGPLNPRNAAVNRYLGDYSGAFNSEQIRLMSEALDQAWVALKASKASYAMGDEAEPARAALAKWIIAAAKGGEFDPRRLSEGALADLAGANKF